MRLCGFSSLCKSWPSLRIWIHSGWWCRALSHAHNKGYRIGQLKRSDVFIFPQRHKIRILMFAFISALCACVAVLLVRFNLLLFSLDGCQLWHSSGRRADLLVSPVVRFRSRFKPQSLLVRWGWKVWGKTEEVHCLSLKIYIFFCLASIQWQERNFEADRKASLTGEMLYLIGFPKFKAN